MRGMDWIDLTQDMGKGFGASEDGNKLSGSIK